MTYPICPRCHKGRMVPMLMSGPACDLACERSRPAEAKEKLVWTTGQLDRKLFPDWTPLSQPVAPIRQVNRYPVTCQIDPQFEYLVFDTPYTGRWINPGEVLTIEYPDGSVDHFTVEQAGPAAVIAQNGTSDFDLGQRGNLVVPV